MSKVLELFGKSTQSKRTNWSKLIADQKCGYTGKRCYKVRKSDPQTSIGTCSVAAVDSSRPIIICPVRMTDSGQIFTDCLHLLTTHEPGNELHVVSEVSIPGGSVDFFLVSTRGRKVMDFVGVELQTLDTTGTVWPERQRLLKEFGVARADKAEDSKKPFGMNWKMTAKTILVQMHHKVRTFEHINKKLALVVQDHLLAYMSREFSFAHLHAPAVLGDSLHLHAYQLEKDGEAKQFHHSLASRLSTDADGIATCLGLQAEPRVDMAVIVSRLEAKISSATRFRPV